MGRDETIRNDFFFSNRHDLPRRMDRQRRKRDKTEEGDETFEWTFGSIRGGISGDLGSGKVGGSGTGERERSFSGKSQTADAWDPSAATSARFSTR